MNSPMAEARLSTKSSDEGRSQFLIVGIRKGGTRLQLLSTNVIKDARRYRNLIAVVISRCYQPEYNI